MSSKSFFVVTKAVIEKMYEVYAESEEAAEEIIQDALLDLNDINDEDLYSEFSEYEVLSEEILSVNSSE